MNTKNNENQKDNKKNQSAKSSEKSNNEAKSKSSTLTPDTKIQMIKDYTHDVAYIYNKKMKDGNLIGDEEDNYYELLTEKVQTEMIMDDLIMNTINLFPQYFKKSFYRLDNKYVFNPHTKNDSIQDSMNRTMLVASILRQYAPLIKGKYIPEYCFDVLFKGINDINTLHDVHKIKYQGYCLFNMCLDRMIDANQINKGAHAELIRGYHNKTHRFIRSIDPPLLFPHTLSGVATTIDYIDIKYNEPTGNPHSKDHDKIANERNQAVILIRANKIFIQYFIQIGLLSKCHNPTKLGFKFINGTLEKRFMKEVPIYYRPRTPITKFFKQLRNNFGNTYQIGKRCLVHKLRKYYGISFLLNIANIQTLRLLCRFTDAKGVKRCIRPAPLTYLTIIMELIDKMVRPKETEPSKPCLELLKKAKKLDKIAYDFTDAYDGHSK